MTMAKSIESLIWSDTSYTLREFLENFGLPNLVRIRHGYYGVNEACTIDYDQIIMFHTLRQNLISEDSAGRPIAIPLKCTNKFLVCPLSTHCRYDPIYVSQMSYVYPEIKYFRVLENDWNEAIEYLKPGSILKIESIDPESYAVKFVNIEQTLPTSCRVVFEPLLDFCEYTLEEIVRLFGLPAKVRKHPFTLIFLHFVQLQQPELFKIYCDVSMSKLDGSDTQTNVIFIFCINNYFFTSMFRSVKHVIIYAILSRERKTTILALWLNCNCRFLKKWNISYAEFMKIP